MQSHALVVGIGGTGAKCVESLVHLAASGQTPANIYPVLVDQDGQNGNVQRCKNAIQAYSDLFKNAGRSRKWFFSTMLNFRDGLLPLIPHATSSNYSAALGLPSMSAEQQSAVRSLFLPCQLSEILNDGYKKRAHMGSLLVEQMLDIEDRRLPSEGGLNSVIDELKNLPELAVIVFGSLFGGTGASGIVRIGKYFKERLPKAKVRGVFLTPYFVIGRASNVDKDGNLVKSDADMQAVKIALQMYKEEMEISFDNIYLIGSEISQLGGEYVTETARSGGRTQLNPSHFFELVAATVAGVEFQSEKYFTCVAETEEEKPPLTFRVSKDYPSRSKSVDLEIGLNSRRLVVAKDFANMVYTANLQDNIGWWKRQPWIDLKFRTDLVNWAAMHVAWWSEMSSEKWDDHCWRKFPLNLDTQVPKYSYSSLLSRYIRANPPSNLANLFSTVESLESLNIRRLKWASIYDRVTE